MTTMIRHLGSACAHAGEGFVTRRIEEDDLAAVCGRTFLAEANLVSADVLGNSASFAGCHIGLADGIEQGRLAVIDVAHDRYHGRARDFQLVGILGAQEISSIASLAISSSKLMTWASAPN